MSPDWSEMRYLSGRNFIVDTTSPSRSWLETYILPEDQPQVLAAIQQAIRTKSTFELEHRVILVDGTAGWTFSRAIPLLDEHGEIVEWLGAASNVTERKQAEEILRRQNEQLQAQVREGTAALRESEERLRTLVETAPLTIWSTDAQGCVVEDCPAFRAFTGQTREEWLGSGWLHAIHPDDRHYAEAQWRRAVETHTPVNAEFRMRHASGEWRNSWVRATPVKNPDGSVSRWIGMNLDMTPYERAQAACHEVQADGENVEQHNADV